MDGPSRPLVDALAYEMPELARRFVGASYEMLAAVLDQSLDCIKVIGPTGSLDFMNRNGRCAMQIDDFAMVAGKPWDELWPVESQPLVRSAVERAKRFENSRFEAFCPTGRGLPRWWEVSVSPLVDEGGILRGIISVSRDVTERVQARQIRDAAAEEMRHRLQNAYALVGALINATAKGSPATETFACEMLQRLQGLGALQSMLLHPLRDGPIALESLVRRLTEPFCTSGCTLEIGSLPSVDLDEPSMQTLALVLGELSTNSSKYGAFGRGGSINLAAELEGMMLIFTWRERADAGPIPNGIEGGGNGFRLIERALGARGGAIDIRWAENGLDAIVRLPSGQ